MWVSALQLWMGWICRVAWRKGLYIGETLCGLRWQLNDVGKKRLRSAAWCLAVLGRTFHNPVAGKILSIASFRRPLDLDQALRTCTELHWVQENRPILSSQKHPKQNWIGGGWKEIKALKTSDVCDERVSELRSCVKVNAAVLGSLSPIVCTVSAHVQQHWTRIHRAQELCESRSGCAGLPCPP